MGVNQYHQVIRKTCVLDMGVFTTTRGGYRLLQHPIYLSEIDVTEQWRCHPTLRNSLLTGRSQDHLEKMHHRRIIHPSSHLREQQRMLHIVEVGAQVDVRVRREWLSGPA